MRILEHEISTIDFKSTLSLCMRFASDGHTDSRPSYTNVEWISYCPDVFRILQDYGSVDFDDYTASICGLRTVRKVIANGKNNSLLRLSHDSRFVLQTISKSEMKVFLDKLPSYYQYLQKYKNTLLTKFYGLHAMKQAKGQKVYFVVMGNILHADLHIHKHFNLKSSSQACSINNESTADELDIVFHLDTSTRNQLLMQLKHDCNFLENMGIVDYSLLLGIHLNTPSRNKVSFIYSQPISRDPSSKSESISNGSCIPSVSPSNGSCSPPEYLNDGSCSPEHSTGSEDGSEDGKSVASHDCNSQNSSQDCHPQSDRGQDSSSAHDLKSPPRIIPFHLPRCNNLNRIEDKLGVETAACAVQKNLVPKRKGKENNVKLFFEITNILQQYTITKRVENVFKSLQPDSSPRGNPKVYSNRFQDFICEVFPEEDTNCFL